jgi:hypothetical protein
MPHRVRDTPGVPGRSAISAFTRVFDALEHDEFRLKRFPLPLPACGERSKPERSEGFG